MPFQILTEFLGAPGGVCFTCRAARRDSDIVVDCDFDVEPLNATVPTEIPGMAFEIASGSLQICSTCVREMGQLIGMASQEQFQEASRQIHALTVERDLLREDFKTASDGVRAYFEPHLDRVFGATP